MITIDLEKEKVDLAAVISLAKQELVLLLAADGTEFFVSEADNFEKEVEIPRASPAFQSFLDERSASKPRVPLEQIAKEIERELQKENRTS